MSSRYITLKSSDPVYNQYLWGYFSQNKSELALPIKSYNLGTLEESVTFEIKNNSEIQLPSAARYLSSLIKLRTYILVLLPMFFILCKHADDPKFDFFSVFCANAALLLLFAGFNIRNDVADHVSGYDRVNLDSAKKPIRLGWITAKNAKLISNLLIAASATVALPSLLLNQKLIVVLLAVFVLAVAAKFAKNNSYKNRHFGELILLIVGGPALLAGLQLATGSDIDSETLMFGTVWGLVVLFLVQVNNFSHIMTSSQHHIKNTMTKLGFDRAQKFLVIMWSAVLAIWAWFQYQFQNNNLSWVTFAVLIIVSAFFLKDVIHIKSPMGSGLQKAKASAQKLFLLMTFIVFLESLERWLQVFA